MKMIEELFYGNVSPTERPIRRGSKLEHLVQLMSKNDDAMRGMLDSDARQAQFEKCIDSQSEVAAQLELDAFTDGFCIAMGLMAEVVGWMQDQEDSD